MTKKQTPILQNPNEFYAESLKQQLESISVEENLVNSTDCNLERDVPNVYANIADSESGVTNACANIVCKKKVSDTCLNLNLFNFTFGKMRHA